MKWLVTLSADSDPNRVARELRRRGCTVPATTGLTSLPGGERVLQCEGPANLPDSARQIAGVVKISPSSDMTLY
jgi:hypothetical protein